ncbi:MAG: ATP-binding protein [Candidatus Aminicenantes bacterium]|nr:MAG: ATP-binding protein [Candidatus Aminicenantes bacterium]
MGRSILEEEYPFKGVKEIIEESLRTKDKGKILLIIGEPGSGKSVFMNQLYDELACKESYLTAIDAAYLNENDSPQEVYSLFEKVKLQEKPKILILDSLDVLAYSRRIELHQWLSCIDKLKKFNDMTVICASRSFEAEHLYPMNRQEWSQKYFMEQLPAEFIKEILKKIDYNFDNLSEKMLEFLKSPIHLKIAADIIKKGEDIKDISSLHELYNRLCEVLEVSSVEYQILISLTELMINDKTVHLAYTLISTQLLQELRALERPGIMGLIRIDEKRQQVSFYHQTLIDFFSALRVLREGETIKEFVLKHKQSLFIRPVIRHILSLLRIQSEDKLLRQLNEVFDEKVQNRQIGFTGETTPVKMHIKTSIITNVASWKDPGSNEGKFILNLFRHREYGQTMAVQFFKGIPCAGWFDVLKDIYICPILKERNSSNIEFRLILSFLENIVADRTPEVLDIYFMLLGKKDDRQLEFFSYGLAEKLFKLDLAGPLIEKYERFLELIVREKIISLDYSISQICRMLSKNDPIKGLRLYIDVLFMYFRGKDDSYWISPDILEQTFQEVIPPLFKRIPFQVLIDLSNFFEKILSGGNSSENLLLDSPEILLFSEIAQRYGIKGIYDWYKDRVLDFCSKLNEESKKVIVELERSIWETQIQLSMLCKFRNAAHFKTEILQFVDQILMSDLEDKSQYEKHELFLRAIEVIFPHLSQQKREAITDSIIHLELGDKLLIRVWIWKPLNHIPQQFHNNIITEKTRQLRENYDFEENYKYTPPIVSTGVQAARSPKSKEELSALEPDDLYNFLIENNELESNWDVEENKFFGGVALLSREVGSLFVEDFDRYGSIVEKLSGDEKNDIYIARFFSALNEKGIADDKFDFAIDLILNIYHREDIQLAIVRFLEKNVGSIKKNQLPKLKEVLLSLSEAQDPIEDKFFEYRKQGCSNDALTEGFNSVRGKLAQLSILILEKFKENFLIEILDKLSKDKTISVRASLTAFLPSTINVLGWERSFGLFLKAFEKGAEEYSDLITKFLGYTPRENIGSLEEILEKMWKERTGNLGKAYAILVTIFYFREFYPMEKVIEAMIDKKLTEEGKKESSRLLLRQLEFKENVDKSLRVINKLLELKKYTAIDWEYMFLMARPEDFPKVKQFILEMINNPDIWGPRGLYQMLEYLEKSLLISPLEVFELLEKMVLKMNKSIWENENLHWINSSKAPLNIINTVFECFPEKEDRAMKVLDRLIELNVSGVDHYLHSLDRI